MRRTDEAFKNELFRRYEQYKKNRRNLRLLAAAPGVVSAMLVCALLFLPKLSLFEANEPVGDQPNETPLVQPDETTDRVVDTTTAPPDTDPDTPDDSSDGDDSYSLPSITEDEVQAILEAGGDLQALIDRIGEPHRIIYQAAPLYEWDLADGRILRVTLSLQITSNRFTGFQFVDPNALPTITEDEMQALVEASGTFQDLIDLIGEPHTSVTSGLYTPAWNLADGRMLIVWVTLNELSTPIPIERYEFWESPMCDIVETLERCYIGSITVTEGFDDNAAFYRNYYSQTNIDAIRELIYDCTILRVMGGPTEVDPSTVDTLQGTSRIIRLHCSPAPGYYGDADLYYDIELLDTNNGLFLRFSDFASPDRWFKISPDPFIALWDYVETHGEDSVIGIVPENPFNSLLDLLDNIEIKTVTVTGPYGTALYMGSEIPPILDRLKNAMSVVYKESSIDYMDGITYTIQIAPSLENEVFNYRTIELFGGKYLRAPDHGITEWYEIDEKAGQALIDSLRTGKPLDEWAIDSYALTSLSARCVQTGEDLAVTGDDLIKIADLLLSINETALTPDYQTFEWLRTIDADPSSVADNAAPLYIVTLHTNKNYSFYLFGDFLFTDGTWWAIDHAAILECLIGGRSYTPPADNLIKVVLDETEITSVTVMSTLDEVLAATGYELIDSDLFYMYEIKDRLSFLTLTECDPQSSDLCDLTILIGHTGYIDRATGLVDDTICITLYGRRYLCFDVTSDESHWYEIPVSEANDLITLLEKIKADLE